MKRTISWLLALALSLGAVAPVGAEPADPTAEYTAAGFALTDNLELFDTINFSVMPFSSAHYSANWGQIDLVYTGQPAPLIANAYADPAITVYELPNSTQLWFSAEPWAGYYIYSFSFDFYDLTHGPIPAYDFHLSPGFDPFSRQTFMLDMYDPDMLATVPGLAQLDTSNLITIDARVVMASTNPGPTRTVLTFGIAEGAGQVQLDTVGTVVTGEPPWVTAMDFGTPLSFYIEADTGYTLTHMTVNDYLLIPDMLTPPTGFSMVPSGDGYLITFDMPNRVSEVWVTFIADTAPSGRSNISVGILTAQGTLTWIGVDTLTYPDPPLSATVDIASAQSILIEPADGYVLTSVVINSTVLIPDAVPPSSPYTLAPRTGGRYELMFDTLAENMFIWVFFSPDIYNFSFGIQLGEGAVRYQGMTITTPMMNHRWVDPGTYMEVVVIQSRPGYRLLDVVVSGLESFILRYDHEGNLLYSFYMPNNYVSIAGVYGESVEDSQPIAP